MPQDQRIDNPCDVDWIGGLTHAEGWMKLDVKKGNGGWVVQQVEHTKKGDALDELDALKRA